MILPDRIVSRIAKLEEFTSILAEIAKTPRDVFLSDKLLQGSAKYYLQVSIECCLDIASHIIASERLRSPKGYSDAFAVLEENSMIGGGLAERLKQMAKLRNRLMQLYGEVDDYYVYEALRKDLVYFSDFKEAILKKFFS